MAPRSEEELSKAPENAYGTVHLTTGFKSYPKYRDDMLKNPQLWLQGKREVEGVYPYWRIHDKLYDFTTFISRHPGGPFWLECTQGTDITEAFESHHFSELPNETKEKYYVKEASTPRNSPFTFVHNGFYKTLKRKVTPIIQEVGVGPSKVMLRIQDSLLFGYLFVFISAGWFSSVTLAILAGVILSFAVAASHNFIHQKDNWRMRIFDLSLLNLREWRISHALSHHLFPNTIYDYEISSFEPYFQTLPRNKKSFMSRYGIIITCYFYYASLFFVDAVTRAILIMRGEVKFYLSSAVPLLLQTIAAVVLSGSFIQGIWLWIVVHTSMSFVFLFIGFAAAHHHPDIYHEGDVTNVDRDWGLHQIAATREKGEIITSLFLVSVAFGNHTLHHLFPTVDHSKLPYLMPALRETCLEFGVKFEFYTIWKLFKGLFVQLANIKPNVNVSECFK